jgi:hypothetical protein
MAAQAVGQVTKGEGDRVGATAKYCAKAVEDDEDDVEADEEEEEEEDAGARQRKRSRCVASCLHHPQAPVRHFPHFYRFSGRLDIRSLYRPSPGSSSSQDTAKETRLDVLLLSRSQGLYRLHSNF